MGYDLILYRQRHPVQQLQFTHPAWGTTAFFYNYLRSVIILLYICDKLFCSYAAYFLGFYREIVFIIFLLVRISLGRNE